MKERFSKIFELWNQRNVGFYKECFNKLETENKTSFNYIAGMFPGMWFIFRKMYSWAMLLVLIQTGIDAIARVVASTSESIGGVISISFFVQFLVLGFFGNTLYYRHVKSKIAKGYAAIEGYNSIDPIWCVLYLFLSGLLSLVIGWWLTVKSAPLWIISLSGGVASMLVIAIPWAIECKKFCSQGTVEAISSTEESVNKYLEKANSKNMVAAMCLLVVASFVLIITASATTKMMNINSKISTQLDDIAVSLENDSKNEETPEIAGKETPNQLDNTAEEIEDTQKEPEVSGSVSEIQSNDIDDQLAGLTDEIKKTLNDSKNSEESEGVIEDQDHAELSEDETEYNEDID